MIRSRTAVSAGLLSLLAASCALADPLVVDSPFRPALAQPEPYLTRLEVAPDFAATIASLRDASQATILAFPLTREGVCSLDLHRLPLPDRTVVVGADGHEHDAPAPDVLLFSGTVAGVPNSSVFLSLSPAGHNGWVEFEGRRFIFTSGPASGPHIPIIYDGAELPAALFPAPAPFCAGALPTGLPLPAPSGDVSPQDQPCRTVRVAVETDYEYTAGVFGGNTVNSAAYATTLLSAVGEIYKRELNVTIQVPYVRVFAANNDPYPDGSSVNDRLGQFQSHWNANMGSVSRNNAHMLTGANAGAGGVAWLGGLCNAYSYGTSGWMSGSFPYPLRHRDWGNWDVMVVAHEMGHNFAAPHTHDTSPQIDGCGTGDCSLATQGTIMSYCHVCDGGMSNISLNLHPRIINENILPYVTSLLCIPTTTPPSISQQPRSANRYTGQGVTFAVTAAGPNLTYQWRKGAANIPGATASFYGINPIDLPDAGSYSVVVSNPCTSITSDPATLTILYCDADVNRDGLVDFFDYLDFAQDFTNELPQADFNHDGTVDFFDYLDFASAFVAHCP
jgi:hypothetical protein